MDGGDETILGRVPKLSSWCWAYLALVVFSLSGFLASKITHAPPGWIAPASSLLTLALGVITVSRAFVMSVGRRPVLGVFALGGAVELLGVSSGFPFGTYQYTQEWWPTVALPVGRFPLQVPFAWVLVTLASVAGALWIFRFPDKQLLSPIKTSIIAVTAGLLAASVDLIMEPTMTGNLAYWHWNTQGPLPGGAPIANFLGWWATAGIGGLLVLHWPPRRHLNPQEPSIVLAGHVLLVIGVGLAGLIR